jgi:hypothetical protein
VMPAQAAHVNKDLPSKSIQLPSKLFMLAFKSTEVEKLLAIIRDIGPQVVGANISS